MDLSFDISVHRVACDTKYMACLWAAHAPVRLQRLGRCRTCSLNAARRAAGLEPSSAVLVLTSRHVHDACRAALLDI